MKKMLAVGLMSGTSLDGVDAALVEIIKEENDKEKYLMKYFVFLPYPKKLKEVLLKIVNNKEIKIQMICSMNVELSEIYKETVKKLLQESNTLASSLSFIAMHGQTVWHNPNHLDGFMHSTLQLGDPTILSTYFNVPVVSHFRQADMAVGGSGAPLVPYANYKLYHSDDLSIALQNIGGIGNVTFLKKGCKPSDIIAFDTGPGNMLIDMAMQKIYNQEFDAEGKIAKQGKIIRPVLDYLLEDDYLKLPYPKSTGREKYNDVFLDNIINLCKNYSNQDADIITTISAYTVETILLAYDKLLPPIDKIIVSGGGAQNNYLMDYLRIKRKCKIELAEDSDGLEALSFVILGYQTINHLPSNVPSVTGANCEVILGSVTNPIINNR